MTTSERALIDPFHVWQQLSPVTVSAGLQMCGCHVQVEQLVLCTRGIELRGVVDGWYSFYLGCSESSTEWAYGGFQRAREEYLTHVGAW